MAGRGAGVLLLLLLVLLVLLVRRFQLLMQLALQLLLLLLLRGCQVGAAVDRGNVDVGLAAHTPAWHKQDSPQSQLYRHVPLHAPPTYWFCLDPWFLYYAGKRTVYIHTPIALQDQPGVCASTPAAGP